MNHSRHEVEKVGQVEGLMRTTTVAENIKKWVPSYEAKRNLRMSDKVTLTDEYNIDTNNRGINWD